MVIGHGVDLVEIGSVEALLGEPTGQFLKQNFRETEYQFLGNGLDRPARISARFAVKEAVLKALGLGYGNGVSFRDVEVETLDTGAPSVCLHGLPKDRAAALGVERWLVSMSHEGPMAMASVLALGRQTDPRKET